MLRIVSCARGLVTTSGENAVVVNTLNHGGSYSAGFTSNGNGGLEAAYSYKTMSPQSELYARGYFYVSQSGISGDGSRFYFIRFKAGAKRARLTMNYLF